MEQRTATIIVGDKKFSVDKEKIRKGDYYRSVMDMFGGEEVMAPTGVSETVVSHYAQFLNRKTISKEELKQCFLHYFLIGDKDYLDYCVGELLDNHEFYWDIVNDFHPELKRDIYLKYPLDLIPAEVRDDEIFFKAWLKDVYDAKYEYGSCHHIIIANRRHIYLHIISFYDNGIKTEFDFRKLKSLESKKANLGFNFVEHGLQLQYYQNGNIKSRCYSKENKFVGAQKTWFENGAQEMEEWYKNGREDGLWTQWYQSGRKREEITYQNGKRHGTRSVYADDENVDGSQLVIRIELYQDGILQPVVW